MVYDLDGFRHYVFESAFLQVNGLTPEEAAPLRTDDLALLRFSTAYFYTTPVPGRSAALAGGSFKPSWPGPGLTKNNSVERQFLASSLAAAPKQLTLRLKA